MSEAVILEMMQRHDDLSKIFHWLPEEGRWDVVGWKAWMAFRELLFPFASLPGVAGGLHYFVYCFHENDVAFNLIPHKYLIEPDGRIGRGNFARLTREDRADYRRLMIAREMSEADRGRLDEIRSKMASRVYFPPRESIRPLVEAVGKIEPDSGAAEFLEELERYEAEAS